MARRAPLTALLLAAAGVVAGLLTQDTPPPAGAAEQAVLIAAGNIGDCASDGDEATASLVEQTTGVVASLGDTAYPTGSAANFADCFDPTWGRFRDRIHPVPGNHDYATGTADPYFAYFGEAAGSPDEGYYSYDVGSWHVVALNSVCDVVDCAEDSDQLRWLERDLQAAPSNCLLAYWHHPRFSSGSIGSDPRMQAAWKILIDAGAEVVISGHAHHYERFALQDERGTPREDGIRQFVVGTGGTVLHPVGSPLLNSEAIVAERHGVLRLDLGETGYAWEFLAVGEQGPLDAGSAQCGERPVQLESMVRTLAPALIAVPVVLLAVTLLLLRRSHFRVH
jgi:acid phosphatase type 7